MLNILKIIYIYYIVLYIANKVNNNANKVTISNKVNNNLTI